jgi:hypothetical protein
MGKGIITLLVIHKATEMTIKKLMELIFSIILDEGLVRALKTPHFTVDTLIAVTATVAIAGTLALVIVVGAQSIP